MFVRKYRKQMTSPAIGATLEITSPRAFDYKTGDTFTLRNGELTIELRLVTQCPSDDAWVLTAEVTNVWQVKSQN